MCYKFLIYYSYNYAIPVGMPLQEEILKRGYEVKWFTYIPASKKNFPSDAEMLNSIEEVIKYNPGTKAIYLHRHLHGYKGYRIFIPHTQSHTVLIKA